MSPGFGGTDIEFIMCWRDRSLKPTPHGKIRRRGRSSSLTKSRGITKAKPRGSRQDVVVNSAQQGFPEPAIVPACTVINPLLPFQPNLSPILTLPEEMYAFDSPLEDTFPIECDLAQSLRNLVYDQSNSELGTLTVTDWQDTTTSPSISGGLSFNTNHLGSERQAIYQLFADSLGPATCGIQEHVGSYKRHMQDCSRIYYEPLDYHSVGSSNRPTPTVNVVQLPKSSANDYPSWFSSAACKQRYRGSCDKPGVQTFTPKEQIGSPSPTARPDYLFGETLDDLFPALPHNAYDDFGSPVVRSQMQWPSVVLHSSLLDYESDETKQQCSSRFTPENCKAPRPRSDSRGLVDVTHLLEVDISAGGPSHMTEQRFMVSPTDNIAFSDEDGTADRDPTWASAQPRLFACSPLQEWADMRTGSTMSRGRRRRTIAAGGGI